MKAIETIHLTKNYGETLALKNINLSIDEEEIFGFVGPNGAGKSTLIKLLLNFIYPSIGQGKIFDLNCSKDGAKIKKMVGYVPSEVRYYPNETSDDLIRASLSFHKNKQIEEIDPLFEALAIERSKKFHELSMGNKKKIAIACALINKPKLLILDEPTNGLDPLIQKRLFTLLREANRNGTTIFISSHNLKEIQDHCSRVAFIKDGRIIEDEDLARLAKKMKVVEMTADVFYEEDLKRLGGNMIKVTDRKIKFSYEGEISRLLRRLYDLDLKDITIKDASLEDTFLDYYEGGILDDIDKIGA